MVTEHEAGREPINRSRNWQGENRRKEKTRIRIRAIVCKNHLTGTCNDQECFVCTTGGPGSCKQPDFEEVGGKQTRPGRSWSAMHFTLSWPNRLLCQSERRRAPKRPKSKQNIQWHDPSQQHLPQVADGAVPDVGGLPSQGASGQVAEGGGGHRGWQPDNPPQLKRRIPPRGSAEHQDAERIWEIVFIIMLLSNFRF